jgi:hypothetical protein
MRSILKFKRKNGDYKFTNTRREWESANGIHYVHYPFMIYKDDHSNKYKLTHLSSGALVCSTTSLHSAKYIASRLLPLPQFLLPDDSLVKHMTDKQRRFCTDVISRYRDQSKTNVIELDKNCPFSI